MQHHDTAKKAEEMLVEKAKRHEKLRLRPKRHEQLGLGQKKGLSGWDLGPDQLQVTTGRIAEPCVMGGNTKIHGD